MKRAPMARAIAAARASTHQIFKHGAAVEKSGRYLGIDYNHGLQHAESRAIGRSYHDGATLYSARITRGGNLAMAKPCGNCMARIRAAGISRVFYTIDNNTVGEIKL